MTRKPKGYWTEETIISELKPVIDKLGRFPSRDELKEMNRSNLVSAMTLNGGLNYFRDKMGYKPLYKPKGYWTEENIISELKPIVEDLDNFPSQSDLSELGESGLAYAITHTGGVNYFRVKLGCDTIQKSPGYWTEYIILAELKPIIEDLDNFPSQSDLSELGGRGLVNAINQQGGFNYFREQLGYDPIKRPNGYWTEDKIMSELKLLIDELGHFPSQTELYKISYSGLNRAIQKHGGTGYFMNKCGITLSMRQKYLSKLSSYTNKRGQKSEQFVKDIITEWTNTHNKPIPNCNVKLSKGNVLEFVCDLDKKIGIDVTNTKASKPATYEQIRKKWRHKDYYLYLDELWIVVFTDILTPADYEKLNRRSPENVKVFSIEEFLRELDYSTENLGKIDRLNECTFHNKEEIINPNRTIDQKCLLQSTLCF